MAGHVSDAVIRRLPGYYRHLRELESAGVEQISSQELGERMHLTPSQIRQDINCFGGFGRQGYGYKVSDLKMHIGEILGLDREHTEIIVGAGNIGLRNIRRSSARASGRWRCLTTTRRKSACRWAISPCTAWRKCRTS